MRLLLIFLMIFGYSYAQINQKSVYIINKNPIQVVRFYSSTKFIVIEYIKEKNNFIPQMIVDSGDYKINRWTVNFQSKSNNSILNGKKIYYDKKIYANWWNLNKTYSKSDTNKYHFLGWIPPKKPYKKPTPKVPNPKIGEYTKSFFQRHVHYYIPEYDSLLITDYCGPGIWTSFVGNKIIEYTGDTSFAYLISDYETVIHESTHGFNSIVGYSNKRWRYKIMVDPSITIYYDDTETYHSFLFKSIVPSEAPTKIFRYNTYVGPGSTVSANLSGIYGLLDEFSAYRNGFHGALMSYFKAKELKQESFAQRFLEQANGTSFAYYEFRQFIAWYLAFAKSNYPKVYEGVMNNWNFRVAFTILDEIYLEDLNNLNNIHKQSSDYKSSYSYNYYQETYATYMKSIASKWSSYIDDFKINGVNSANWKDKLKTLPPLDPNVKITHIK